MHKRIINGIFFFVLIIHVYYNLNIPRLNSDNMAQAITAVNYLDDRGFSLSSPNFNDLSNPDYTYDMRWPAGYFMLIIPLLLITKNILIINSITVGLGFILLFLGLKRVVDALKLSQETQILFWLFIAFAYTPFRLLGTTDLFSAALILFATGMSIDLFSKNSHNPTDKRFLVKVGCISLLALGASFFRYAYFPISFFIVIALLWQTVKDKRHTWPFILSLFIVAAGIYGIQTMSTFFDRPHLQEQMGASFKISGLLNIHNFALAAFIPEHIIREVFNQFLASDSPVIFWFLYLANLTLIGVIAFLVVKQLLRQNTQQVFLKQQTFAIYLLIIIGLLTIAPLIYRSFKSGFWGYDQFYRVYRYYTLATIAFIGICFILFDLLKNKQLRYLLFMVIFLPNLLYFSYIQTQFKPFNPKANLAHFYAPEGTTYDYLDLHKYMRPYNDTETIFVISKGSKLGHVPGADQFLYLFAQIEGAQWMPTEQFIEKNLKTSQTIDIIVAQPTEIDKPELNKKIQKYNAKKIASLEKARFNLFHFILKPNIDAPQ